MTRVSVLVANLIADESGQDLVEYALIVAIMALASIAIMQTLASSIATSFSGIGTRITGAI
jgi:pilus assembly protein Flp/PilA